MFKSLANAGITLPLKKSSLSARRWRLLACCYGVLVAGACATSCTQSSKTRELPNGLIVTPITVERSDVAQILDIRMWRFKVQLPKPNQTLNCVLEVRRKGKPSYTIGGFAAGPIRDSQTEVIVGLHPLSDSWNKSSQVKTFVGMSDGGAGSGVHNNPFKNCDGLGYGEVTAEKDGSMLLMVGSKKGKPAYWPGGENTDASLFLVLKPEDVKYPDGLLQ